MLDYPDRPTLDNARARHCRTLNRRRTLATLAITAALIGAGLSLAISCRMSTPQVGVGFNVETGSVGFTVGPMTFGDTNEATAVMPYEPPAQIVP